MDSKLNPYLNFKGKTRQAMEFYHSIFGGKLDLRTYKEYHASQDPSEDDLIMHSELDNGKGITFMAADTPDRMEHRAGTNFSMMLGGDNEAQLRAYFEKLAAGGKASMPLTKAMWGDTFGSLTDQFGIDWMVNISAQPG
jgi:PhnB protein